jgi:hypothetical protein
MTRFVIFLFSILTCVAFGQDSNTIIPPSNPKDIRPLGGMYYDLSSVRLALTHSIGGRGGIVINKKWIVGGSAQANLALGYNFIYLGLPAKIYTGQGGVWFGRFLFPDKAWNLALSNTLSGGVFGSEVRLSEPDQPLRTADAYNTEFFQWSPQLDVFVKVRPQIKLSATIGYRFTLGMKYNPVVNNSQMNSVFTQVGFTFGEF